MLTNLQVISTYINRRYNFLNLVKELPALKLYTVWQTSR